MDRVTFAGNDKPCVGKVHELCHNVGRVLGVGLLYKHGDPFSGYVKEPEHFGLLIADRSVH